MRPRRARLWWVGTRGSAWTCCTILNIASMNERSFFSRSRRRGRNAINVLLRPVCHFSSLRTIIERRALSVPCLTVRRTPRVAAVTALRRIQRRCLRRARSDLPLRPGRTVRARALSPRVPSPISDETRGPRSNLSSSTNVSNRRGRPRGVEAPPDASARLAPNPSRPSRTIAAPPRARAFPDRQSPRLTPSSPSSRRLQNRCRAPGARRVPPSRRGPTPDGSRRARDRRAHDDGRRSPDDDAPPRRPPRTTRRGRRTAWPRDAASSSRRHGCSAGRSASPGRTSRRDAAARHGHTAHDARRAAAGTRDDAAADRADGTDARQSHDDGRSASPHGRRRSRTDGRRADGSSAGESTGRASRRTNRRPRVQLQPDGPARWPAASNGPGRTRTTTRASSPSGDGLPWRRGCQRNANAADDAAAARRRPAADDAPATHRERRRGTRRTVLPDIPRPGPAARTPRNGPTSGPRRTAPTTGDYPAKSSARRFQ